VLLRGGKRTAEVAQDDVCAKPARRHVAPFHAGREADVGDEEKGAGTSIAHGVDIPLRRYTADRGAVLMLRCTNT
jgi:hypothetical protein